MRQDSINYDACQIHVINYVADLINYVAIDINYDE